MLNGLLEDEAHWHETMEEAATNTSPTKLRNLFAIMLVVCGIGAPMELWDKHKEDLSEDILWKVSYLT